MVRFEAIPKRYTVPAATLLIAVIGFLDYASGYELSFAAFYLVPMFILAWSAGRWAAYAGAVGAAAARTLSDLLAGKTYPAAWMLAWNAGMRLVVFAVIAVLLTVARRYVEMERAQSRTDHLTGAMNKKAFLEALQSELGRARRYGHSFTLVYLDLDNFKSVNDSLGHLVGDALLVETVAVFRSNIRVSDLVARLGGDEFAVILPETDEGGARVTVAKLVEQFGRSMSAHTWPVTLSVGSSTSAGNESVEQLIARADGLMYAAKMRGKNSARYGGPAGSLMGG